jgi:hypothetical protein
LSVLRPDNVAKAVLQKNYDAGGLMLSAAEKHAGQGLKILATSAKIPQFPGALGAQVTGFARINDSDYDGIRTMLKRLKA